jgi:hypothetical protein
VYSEKRDRQDECVDAGSRHRSVVEENRRPPPVCLLPRVPLHMASFPIDNAITNLWELSDGTRACVVEHPAAPRWEVCLVRSDRVVQRHRCDTIDQLMATAIGLHAAASDIR